MSTTILFAAAFAAAALVILYRTKRPERAVTVAHDFARKVDLALEGVAEHAVARRLGQRERAGAWIGLVGVVLAAAWSLLTPSGPTSFAGLGIAVAYFAGHALGHGIVAWRETSRATPAEGPRIARASTPMHTDYVARHERWGGWVLAGATVAIAVGLVVVDATGVALGELPVALLVATGVVPVLVMAGYEVAAARLLCRRQVAATTLDLAWDDALRARTLRDMLTAALMVGTCLPVALLAVVQDRAADVWPDEPGWGIAVGVLFVLLVLVGVLGVVSLALRPERHFRARLWPQPVVRSRA